MKNESCLLKYYRLLSL